MLPWVPVRCALKSAKYLQGEEALTSQMASKIEALTSQMASKIEAAKAEGAKETMEKIFALGFHSDFEKFYEEFKKYRDKEYTK